MRTKKLPAIFLDRDGVITRENGVITKPGDVVLYDDAAEAISNLKNKGFLVIIVTNQSGIARGLFSEEELDLLHEKIKEKTRVDAIYYCPHCAEGIISQYSIKCECRKPNIGLLKKACKDFDIDLSHSWMVGDRRSDILFGKNAGIKTILVKTGYGGADLTSDIQPDIVVDGIKDVARVI